MLSCVELQGSTLICAIETQDNIALPDTTISSPSDAAIEMAALTLSPPPTSPEADATVDANMGKTTEGNSAPLASQKNKTSEEQPPNEQSSKRISRIEDSVEALDALEDAIEKIGEAMPVSASDASSPEANRKSTRSPKAQLKTASVHGQKSSKATSRRTPAASTSTSKPPLGRTKTATEAKRTLSTNSPAAKQRSLEARKASETVSKQPMSTSKRISSVHKAPFQPVKSSKPVTKSNFELPGEAVARKLKEQREERQKREEEGLKTTSQAPSGTPQKRRAPEVKMTATARARLSLAQNGTVTSGKAPVTAISASKTGAKATKPTTKDSHPAKTRAPLPKPRAPVSANTSVKRGSLATSSIVSRQVSTSSQPRTSIGGDLSNQKVRGKEVFSRPKQVLKAKEDEKKAKEEAAKKARIEAAERGRLASREWAEKQKARNLAAQAAKAASENEATAA